MNKKKHLIIDGNNLLHRAYHQFKRMQSREGVPSSIVFGFTHVLRSLVLLHKPDELLVVFDGGKSKERKFLLPDYKVRTKRIDFDYEDFLKQKESTEKILKALGIAFTSKRHVEADDIIHIYARKYKMKGTVIIVSSDKDFNQLIGKRVSIWNPSRNDRKGMRIHHKNLLQEFGYTAKQCVDYLILDGDKSDNIPGYPGVGPKTALKFIANYGSIKKYLFTDEFDEDKKIKRKELEELFYNGRVLIDIRHFCKKHLKASMVPIKSPKGKKINRKELAIICSEYSINKFVTKEFQKPFKQLLSWK